MQKILRINNKKSFLELINNYNRVVRYKVNMQKSTTFLYSGNKQQEFETKYKVFPLTLKNKYWDINLTKYAQYLYYYQYLFSSSRQLDSEFPSLWLLPKICLQPETLGNESYPHTKDNKQTNVEVCDPEKGFFLFLLKKNHTVKQSSFQKNRLNFQFLCKSTIFTELHL